MKAPDGLNRGSTRFVLDVVGLLVLVRLWVWTVGMRLG